MTELKPRRIVKSVFRKVIGDKRAVVLIGARQVGKTSIMRLLMERLLKKMAANRVFYFDLEDINILDIVNRGVDEFLSFIKAKGADFRERCFVFLDEIQYMENPSNFLKLIIDHHSEIKLIVSGSSSFAIKSKFRDSLAGRKIIFNIYHLDFGEFLEFKESKELAGFWDNSDWEKARFFRRELMRHFEEYTVFGGLPKVTLLSKKDDKIEYLRDVVNSYIKKDIKDLFRIDNPFAFNRLLKLLAAQAANVLNFSNFTSNCGISRQTLERYLFILESTFVIKLISPFYKNRKKEITKMPRVYFLDTGIRNLIMGDLNNLESRGDVGGLVENSIFSMIIDNVDLLDEIHYWRTKAGAEMDFVLRGERLRAYEVKYQTFKQPKISRSIRSFVSEYSPEKVCICTKDFYFRMKIDTTNILFLPSYFIK